MTAESPMSSQNSQLSREIPAGKKATPRKRDARFWVIIVSLALTGMLVALEGTVVSTALPSIVRDIGGREDYVWVVLAFLLTLTAFQPLYGQLADIFGRRYPLIIAVIIYALGSGICGGSHSVNMMIAGRATQGIGGAGINVLVELIPCDLLPLRKRAKYTAIIFGFITIGTALGPVFSGLIVQYSNWRWVFYLNLPVAGTALVLLVLFLQVNHNRSGTAWDGVKRIDVVGNITFVASCSSALLALGWADTLYPWSSFRISLPLVLGFTGLAGFLFYEGSRSAIEPVIPLRLFRNRTSLVAFVLTFFNSLLMLIQLYFLPVYFQAVLLSSPARSGVQLLPTVLVLIPFAALGGIVLEKFGEYKIMHLLAFAITAVGLGVMSLLDEHSSTGAWVGFQFLASMGSGFIVPTLLPAVQARLSDADTASSTATWGFIRSFGMVWGSAIPSAIFNNRFNQLADRISDPSVRTLLSNGQAYEHATRDFVMSLPTSNGTRQQVIGAYSDSLKSVWYASMAFAVVGFLFALIEERVELRKELETQYGLKESSPAAQTHDKVAVEGDA